MRCEKVIQQLSACLDGQLPAAEKAAVRSHLAGCARCRAELEALDRAAYEVADLPRLQAPGALRDQVMAKLEGVTPDEAHYPRWRLYWGVAATIAVAAVIMLLTRSATPPRPAPEAVALAAKKVPDREVAQIARSEPANAPADAKRVEEKSLPVAAAPVSSERIILPSADPQASYCNAIAVAAKGGWLPAELLRPGAASTLLQAAEVKQDGHQVPQITLRVKRNQVPLLKSALAEAGLKAAEEKRDEMEAAQPVLEGTAQFAFARSRADTENAARTVTNAAPAESRFGPEARSMKADTIAVAAAPPAAAMNAPQASGGAAGGSHRQVIVEQGSQQAETTTVATKAQAGVGNAAASGPRQITAGGQFQRTETTTVDELRNADADGESLVRVTLLFPFAESPVPTAAPTAGAATAATPE